MSRHTFLPNLCLRHALLIHAHRRNHTQCPRIDRAPSITHNTYHYLLPRILAPGLAALPPTQMRDILFNTVHSPTEEFLVFVVHGDDDEQLRSARGGVVHLTESEARVFKVVGVAGGGGVSHVGKFVLGAVRAPVKELCRDSAVKHKVTMEESG